MLLNLTLNTFGKSLENTGKRICNCTNVKMQKSEYLLEPYLCIVYKRCKCTKSVFAELQKSVALKNNLLKVQ